MKKITIGTSDLQASPIILGCMRIGEMSVNELERLVFTAIENGVNYFDHADIYWEGRSEELFGQLVIPVRLVCWYVGSAAVYYLVN